MPTTLLWDSSHKSLADSAAVMLAGRRFLCTAVENVFTCQGIVIHSVCMSKEVKFKLKRCPGMQTNTTLDASQCYTVKTTKSTSSSVATVPFSVPVSGNVYLRFKDRVALDVDRGQTPLITDIFFPGEEYNDVYWSVPVKILLQRAKVIQQSPWPMSEEEPCIDIYLGMHTYPVKQDI